MRSLLLLVPAALLAASVGWALAVADGADRSPAITPGTPAAPTSDSDAAARRHAKRTQCLKEAKAKKLVGAHKAAFLKECLAPPHP